MGYQKTISDTAVQRLERLKRRTAQIKIQVSSDIQASERAESDEHTDNGEDIDATEDSVREIENSVSCQTEIIDRLSIETQTELTLQDLCNREKAYMDMDTVKELAVVRDVVSKLSISENTFRHDDRKTLYYTGMQNFKTLMIIFSMIKTCIPQTATSSLTKFQQFVLTLMHLRLNLDITDLSYRFCVSKSTVSRIFTNCLYIMYYRLQKFLFWPEREELVTKVPLSLLEAFGRKVTVIVDCFEIFIERPSNLLASAQTWSNYKHHNTVKFLIGICPQGAITFISSAWGGRATDQHIAQNCGILDKLLLGDIVLCDRGFNIRSDVELYCAEVKIPAFTKGKKQLSAIEVEESRNISHVRIHVERVIGTLRQKYRILHSTMPISTVSRNSSDAPAVIDQIVKVCCCLLNISSSVIPFD